MKEKKTNDMCGLYGVELESENNLSIWELIRTAKSIPNDWISKLLAVKLCCKNN